MRSAWAAFLLTLAVPSAANELEPRPVRLTAPIALHDALAEIRKQTGNSVRDARSDRSDPKLNLPTGPTTFWPLLDEIGKATSIGFTPYGADGVSLTDARYRTVPTAYSGLFRLSLQRIEATRDLAGDAGSVRVRLDAAWEPRFQPYYIEPGAVAVSYAADTHGKELKARVSQGGQVSVAGRVATEFDLRLPAPDRSSPRIESLQGSLSVIGPTRMLEFDFPQLTLIGKGQEPRTQQVDGVTVRLKSVKANRDRWTIELSIQNPPGNTSLDSSQSWLDNNTIALVHGEGKDKVVWTPPAGEHRVWQQGAEGAHVSYYFPLEGKRLPDGGISAWSLHYTTPARIVQIEVPYQFNKVELP